jgi:hypothetical protein
LQIEIKLGADTRETQYPSTIDELYFQAALAGKEYISNVVIDRNNGALIINLSSPIYDYAGNFQGLILGSVETTTLETLLPENWTIEPWLKRSRILCFAFPYTFRTGEALAEKDLRQS